MQPRLRALRCTLRRCATIFTRWKTSVRSLRRFGESEHALRTPCFDLPICGGEGDRRAPEAAEAAQLR
eukprot:5575359-Pleurochrysis_carterae.AAC.1